MRHKLYFLTWILIMGWFFTPTWSQGQSLAIKGQVQEQIVRPDGKELLRALKDVKVYIKEYPSQVSFTDANGRFVLNVNPSPSNKEIVNVVFEKLGYDLMENKDAHRPISSLRLKGRDLRNDLTVYLSKENTNFSSNAVSSETAPISGYIKDGDKGIPDIEVKVLGADDLYYLTRQEGFFELYVPSYLLNEDTPFILKLTQNGKSRTVEFANFNEFSMNGIVAYDEVFPSEPSNDETEETDENNSASEDEVNEIRNMEQELLTIEEKFKNFISDLDRINFRQLDEQDIKQLKDSLKSYAQYFTNIIAPTDSSSSERIRLEKKVVEIQNQLTEKQNELVAAQSANKDKMIIILSLALGVLTLSFLSYYYFYVNKKIKSQAHELTKRHQFIEFLLRELNHRVTNNLQVIHSMLRRKMRRISDENAKQVLKEIQGRVMDISTVHTGLYSNTSRNERRIIKIHEYLSNITNTLQKLYGFEDNPIDIRIQTPDIDIEHRNAVFFGLVVNELVTNAFKYAFEGIEEPALSIELQKQSEDQFYLKVQDNGHGIPNGFRLQDAKSSGLKLVHLITQMLDGSFNMSSANGTQFELVFTMK